MRHSLETSQIVILGGFFLFLTLVLLFTLDTETTGRATTATRVNIINATEANCSFIAYAGRNTVSLPCISTAQLLISTINNSNVFAVYQYVPGSSDLWRVSTQHLPSYVVSDLQYLSRRAGYVLIANATVITNASGLVPVTTTVPIVAGWQLVGYPSISIGNASTEFSNINDSMTEARTYNNSAAVYESYLNSTQGGTLNTTVPGEGYWINGTQSTTWVVTGT